MSALSFEKDGFMRNLKISSIHLIPLSFLALIITGSLFLMFPFSSFEGTWTPFIDAFFTSASAVCVTGLVVTPTYMHWSLAGQIILLILIQFGSLGIVSVISIFMLITNRKFSLRDRVMLRDALNLENTGGVLTFLSVVVIGTLTAELLGAALYAFTFVPQFGWRHGLWVSVFTSVSAFCNAGFDIIGPDSLIPYQSNGFVLGVTMFLIVISGLGFMVWMDIGDKFRYGISRRWSPLQILKHLSEHSKLVLSITAVLVFGGAVIFLITEYRNPDTIGTLPFSGKVLNSLFQSVTLRTAGFNSFSQKKMTNLSCIIAYLLMFIGGSPMGTAGGVKTTTFYIAILNVVSYIKNQTSGQAFRRTISAEQMKKASAIADVFAVTVIFFTLLLISTNPVSTQDGFFEIISAAGTVGLTRDVTFTLNTSGKQIVAATMYLGRIGPISLAVFFTRGSRKKIDMKLAEGSFFVG